MAWVLRCLLPCFGSAVSVHIHIATPWKNVERRHALRRTFAACRASLGPEHAVAYTFFLGDPASAGEAQEVDLGPYAEELRFRLP